MAHLPAGDGIMILEVTGSSTHWMEPRDLDIRELSSAPGAALQFPGEMSISGAFLLKEDDSVEFLSKQAAEEHVYAMAASE